MKESSIERERSFKERERKREKKKRKSNLVVSWQQGRVKVSVVCLRSFVSDWLSVFLSYHFAAQVLGVTTYISTRQLI